MALGYTAYFGTSAIRPYTGPTGPIGHQIQGTGGTAGGTGATGATGSFGPSGPTGTTIVGTYLQDDPSKPGYNYYVIQFSDNNGNVVTAAPRGLTGGYGVVVGGTANFGNTGNGVTGIFIDHGANSITWGTQNPNQGICGATLSFRRIGVSGDFVLYQDLALGIGTGPTFSMIGISGPDGAKFGTVTGQSVGEIAYLVDRKNAKDAYGLTFTDNQVTSPPGAGDGGLTWGTVTTKFVNHSEYFHVHGNSVAGVQKDPFFITTTEGNVHLVYAPFKLEGITVDYHASRSPIAEGPTWVDTEGTTAEYGESVNVTLIVDGGPRGISFGNGFYFSDEPKFTHGRDILNCLSYDNGKNWFVTIAGVGYGISGPKELSDQVILGSCCNPDHVVSGNDPNCYDYVTPVFCTDLGDGWNFREGVACSETVCGLPTEEEFEVLGSCCLNTNLLDDSSEATCVDNVTSLECLRFNGNFRRFISCDPVNYPCGDPCDIDFGKIGACCEFDSFGTYIRCSERSSIECAALYDNTNTEAYTTYNGDDSFCINTSCCDFENKFGACCLDEGVCLDQVRPVECSTLLNGIYQGNNTDCAFISCTCSTDNEGNEGNDDNGNDDGNGIDDGDGGNPVDGLPGACCTVQPDADGGGAQCDDGGGYYTINRQQCESQNNEYTVAYFLGEGTVCDPNNPFQCSDPEGVDYLDQTGVCCDYCCQYDEEVTRYECWNFSPGYRGGVFFPGRNHPEDLSLLCDNVTHDFTSESGAGQCCHTNQYNYDYSCGGARTKPQCEYYGGTWVSREEYGGDVFCTPTNGPCVGIEPLGGAARSSIPYSELGSCCVYPLQKSCSPDLDFSCLNVSSIDCERLTKIIDSLYGFGAYGVKFTSGKCCCNSQECGGTTPIPSDDLPGLSFGECLTTLYGGNALECGGPCRDENCNPRIGGSGFACVFDCNCSSAFPSNVSDDTDLIEYECCSCNPDCVERDSKNTFCSSPDITVSCETSCESCPVSSYTTAGACCCTDYSESGLADCPECKSCSYITEAECTAKRTEMNECPNPLTGSGSYECDCTFYPESTCSDLVENEVCESASLDEEKHTPIVVPILGTRTPPKLVGFSGQISLVPTGREQLSGILCTESACEVVYDLYEYISINGFPSGENSRGEIVRFLPYVPEIYSHMERYSKAGIPATENAREHFIKMAVLNGHGIQRPLTLQEMFNAHSDINNLDLTIDHFKAMLVVHNVEKTITQSDPGGQYDWYRGNSDVLNYCACESSLLSDVVMETSIIEFPIVSSPTGERLEIRVPKYTSNFVARRLGGVATAIGGRSTSIFDELSFEKNSENKPGGNQRKLTTKNMEGVVGTCKLENGNVFECEKEFCINGLGGQWTENKKINTITHKRTRTISNAVKYKKREGEDFRP